MRAGILLRGRGVYRATKNNSSGGSPLPIIVGSLGFAPNAKVLMLSFSAPQ